MKLIQTKDYLLLIDEEAEIKEGNYYCFPTITGFFMKQYFEKQHFKQEPCISLSNLKAKKIIAHYPLSKETIKLDLPLLPKPFKDSFDITTWSNEVATKQFSLEDMKKAFFSGRESLSKALVTDREAEEIIQSLSTQQLPKEFIPKYTDMFKRNNEGDIINADYHTHSKKLKTIINPEGKEEIQGRYVY